MRRVRRAVLAVLLGATIVCAVMAAGCGGEKDLTEGLTPEQILDQSRETAAAVTTYHPVVTLTLDVTSDGTAGGILGRLGGQPVTIVVDGPVRRPTAPEGAAFAFDLDIQIAGFDLAGKLTMVDDALYLSFLGADYQLGLSPEQVRAIRFPPEPGRFIASPQEVGREEIDGVPTVHLKGEIATDAVLDYLLDLFRSAPGLLGGRQLPEGADLDALRATLRDSVQESSAEVWIGTQDLLPHRVAAKLDVQGPISTLLPGVTGLDLDVKADFSGFDEPVDIQAPANPVPFDPGILSGLGLGG